MPNDFNGLTITEIDVTLWHDPGNDKIRAFAGVVLNGAFAVRSMRITEMANGRHLVAMPNRRRVDGTLADTFCPISHAGRRWLDDAVLRAYEAELRRNATRTEWWDALDEELIKPSSCGHPDEQTLFESVELRAAG